MDRKYIDEHHIVERYFADLLSDGEREAFEAYYLEHPEMVRHMETIARFKAGMLQLEHRGELDGIMAARSRTPRWTTLAAAAAIAAIAITIALFTGRTASAPPLLAAALNQIVNEHGQPLEIASSHRVMRMRGTRADAEITVPQTPGAIELEILPETEDTTARYRVVLKRADRETIIAQADGLAVNSDGFVAVYLNPARLTPDRYTLELRGASAANATYVSTFSLLVRN